MRILVYGSRTWADRDVIHYGLDVLADALPDGERLIVLNGFAPGADRMADEWASAHPRGLPLRFRADWPTCDLDHRTDPCPVTPHRKVNRFGQEFCPLAGFRRNQEMAEQKLDVAYGYDLGTPGTADMTRRLRAAGIEPIIRTMGRET